MTRHRTLARVVISSVVFAGCGPSQPAAAPAKPAEELAVVVEGPCPTLRIHALGDERVLVYGDDGYALESWLPGDELPAAESLAVLRQGGAFVRKSLLDGLPRDSRGYVPFDLELGGRFSDRAWLLLVATRYQPHGRGALFERKSRGFTFAGTGWIRSSDDVPVELPREASRLPPLPVEHVCPSVGLTLEGATTFVPLASVRTPRGGVFVAGRCDDPAITNYRNTTLLVAHGAPGAHRWDVQRTPGTEALDGIVNVALEAKGDDDAHLVAYEPMKALAERRSYLAHYDGRAWSELATRISDGLMSVARTDDGGLLLAGGRALYRRDAKGVATKVPLPPLRFAGPPPRPEPSPTEPGVLRDVGPLEVRKVDRFEPGELWVTASYTVEVERPGGHRGAMRGTAIYSTRRYPRPMHCDAREPAETALTELEGAP